MDYSDSIPLHVPAPLQAQINAVAEQCEQSADWVIQQALTQFLDVYAWQHRQIEQAVHEADTGAKWYTGSEVDGIVAALKP